MNMQKLKDKVAIITGGSRGIGRAITRAFLAEGARVMIVSRSQEELDATVGDLGAGAMLHAFRCDVSRPEEVRQAVQETIRSFGTIDILVNVAGIYGPIGPSESVDFDEWKKTFEVNVFGTFRMIQEVVPAMIARGGGKIINFSGGGDGPLARFSAYNASKVSIVRLTETLAEEWKASHIDINALAPGPVNTHFLDQALKAGEALVGKEKYAEILKQKETGGVPPEKTAELCVFLASADSDGLTGKFLSSIWDKWQSWDKERIASIMSSNAYTLRRVKEQ
jgi:3-oxoacyl-[acyl-carrier protein] reductase